MPKPCATDALNTTPVVELENLKVRLGRREILHGITCRLGVSGTGKAVGLLGPNGAGKSTLILTLLGFLRPSAGRARILGLDCRRSMGEARSRIGYMPENDSFIGDMTAVAFLRQMAELSGLPPEAALEKAHEVLFHVGLGEARYRELRTYSLGMKQMAKLAQAIVHGPELVVLDEPTNGLDPAARRRMLKLIAEMKNEQGMNVLVCSHLLRDIEQVCDEAVIMKDGAIVHHCNLEEERRSNRHFVELEVTGDDGNLRAALPEIGAEGVPEGDGRWRIVLPPGVEVEAIWGLAGRQNLLVRKLTHRRDTLEEIFLKAMGHLAQTPGEAARLEPVEPDGELSTAWRSTNEDTGDTRARSRGAGPGSWCCPATPGGGSTSSASSSCSRCWRSSGRSCAPASSISPITRSCCRASRRSFVSSSRSTGSSSRSSCTCRRASRSSSRRWPGPA